MGVMFAMTKSGIFLTLLLLVSSGNALSCSCRGTVFSAEFFQSDVVVIGYPSKIEESPKKDTLESDFIVTEVLKGDPKKNIKISGHSFSSVACSQKLIEAEYVLFITEGKSTHISRCSSSQIIRSSAVKKYLQNLSKNPPQAIPENHMLGLMDQMCITHKESMGEKCVDGKYYFRPKE